MTRAEAARVFNVIIAAFPTQAQRIPNVSMSSEVWEIALADLDYKIAHAAATKLILTARFLPSIAEFREVVVELRDGARKTGAQAWGEVRRAIGAHGHNKAPGVDFEFADQVAAQCVIAFGWRDLCLSENLTADRARFIEMYDVMARRDAERRVMGLSPGGHKQLPSGTRPLAEAVAVFAQAKLKPGGNG